MSIKQVFTIVSSTSQLSSNALPDLHQVDGWVVSSESCSFPSVCAKLYRDVAPGEIIKLEKNRRPKTLANVPRPEGNLGFALGLVLVKLELKLTSPFAYQPPYQHSVYSNTFISLDQTL